MFTFFNLLTMFLKTKNFDNKNQYKQIDIQLLKKLIKK